MEIKSTKEYKIFKYMRGNRDLSEYQVNQLVSSISENNLLPYNPIIVNPKMEVVDGQHRLEAAKRLGFEIYYIEAPIGNIQDVAHLNTTVRPWEVVDYMESYTKLGYTDYQVLKDFAERTGLSPTISASLLYSKAAKHTAKVGSMRVIFRSGDFKVNHLDWATELADRLNQIRPFMEGPAWKSRDFIQSLIIFYRQVDHTELIEKLREYPDKLYAKTNILGYIRQFEDVINLKSKNKRVISYKTRDDENEQIAPQYR